MISFILLFVPILRFASADITRKKIKIGATARNALTKMLPKTPTFSAILKPKAPSSAGPTSAIMIPRTKPVAILFTKLPWNNRRNKRDVFILLSFFLINLTSDCYQSTYKGIKDSVNSYRKKIFFVIFYPISELFSKFVRYFLKTYL